MISELIQHNSETCFGPNQHTKLKIYYFIIIFMKKLFISGLFYFKVLGLFCARPMSTLLSLDACKKCNHLFHKGSDASEVETSIHPFT